MKLRNICKIVTDSINPKKQKNKLFELYSLPAFDDFKRPENVYGSDIESNKYLVPEKTILFNKLNVRFKRIWRITNNNQDNKICSTEFLPIIVDEKIADFDYVYFLLMSDQVTEYLCAPTTNTSGSHKRIDPDFLLDMEISLPELDEQVRVARKLKTLDDEVQCCFDFETKSFKFLKDTYDYWFVSYNFPNNNGDAYSENGGTFVEDKETGINYPTKWSFNKIGQYFNVVRGVSYKPEDTSEIETDIHMPLLRSNNIYDERLIHEDIVFVDKKRVSEEQILHANDVFICMSNGSKNLIGKNTIIPYDTEYAFGAFCAKIKNIDCDYLGFINLFFKSNYYKAYIAQICANTSINNIGNEMLTDLKYPLPPLNIAKKFNEIYLKVMSEVGNAHKFMLSTRTLLEKHIFMDMNGVLINSSED